MTRLDVRHDASALLKTVTPVWRSQFIFGGLLLAFLVLAGRAFYVQVWGNDFFRRQGEVRFARTLELPANRGRILDRNGEILATSVLAQSVWAIPEDVDLEHPRLVDMARLLDIPLADLKQRLANGKNYVWIRRQVDEPLALQVKALDIKGVYLRQEYKRKYPEGPVTAHLVGFANVEDKGQEGIELAFDDALSGVAGSRRVIKDRLGRVVEDVRDAVPPLDGRDVQLSIDRTIQFHAYQQLQKAVQEHKAHSGSAVVLDALTGEVLALANYPSYDPNQRRHLTGEQLRNRTLTDMFEPGSTVKPFIAALALEKGVARPSTVIQTAPGYLRMGKYTISDVHPNGALTLEGVIQKSSNVGTVKLAMQMPARDIWETYTQIGFGRRPDVPFPGTVGGRLRPYGSWLPIEQATMSYGYGLSTSLFQLAQAYTVFASDGLLLPVSVLKVDTPVLGVPVFSRQNARAVRHMLSLVTGSEGTAQKAQTVGYSVGGKTGTARKFEGNSYAGRRYRSFFVGLAPITRPRVVVAVMIDEPSNGAIYGGAVAAPVFSATVLQSLRILGVPPDEAVKHQILLSEEEDKP